MKLKRGKALIRPSRTEHENRGKRRSYHAPRKRQPRKKPQKSISRSEKGRMGQGSSNWTSKTSEGIPTHLIDGVLFAFPQRVGVVGRGDGGSRGDGGERRGGGCGRKLKERAHRRRIGQERGREGGRAGGQARKRQSSTSAEAVVGKTRGAMLSTAWPARLCRPGPRRRRPGTACMVKDKRMRHPQQPKTRR